MDAQRPSTHEELPVNIGKEQLKPFINSAALTILAAYALTTVHHIFGGLVDGADDRLVIPGVLAPLMVIAMVSLYALGRNGSVGALITVGVVALLWVLLLGLFHGGYAHLYKDIVFLVDGPPSLYYPLNPSEHYPPDNIFFEVTGVLDLLAAAVMAYTTTRLISAWRRVAKYKEER